MMFTIQVPQKISKHFDGSLAIGVSFWHVCCICTVVDKQVITVARDRITYSKCFDMVLLWFLRIILFRMESAFEANYHFVYRDIFVGVECRLKSTQESRDEWLDLGLALGIGLGRMKHRLEYEQEFCS